MFLYDGDNVVLDVGGPGGFTLYVTPFLDQNLSMTRSGAAYYYSHDGLGSVRTLTDSAGAAVNRYDYTAWGEIFAPGTSATVCQRYMFTGREQHPTSTLTFFRYRENSPAIGRFLARDPRGYFAMDLGVLYEVAFDNPHILEDVGRYVVLESACLYEYARGGPTRHGDARGLGFEVCRRDIAIDSWLDWFWVPIVNLFGGEHTYVQYSGGTSTAPQGWGFGGPGMTMPQPEKHFKPTACGACQRVCTILKHGSAAGKKYGKHSDPKLVATDSEILNCLGNTPPSQQYNWRNYNCQSWALEATAACGLECQLPPLAEPKPLPPGPLPYGAWAY